MPLATLQQLCTTIHVVMCLQALSSGTDALQYAKRVHRVTRGCLDCGNNETDGSNAPPTQLVPGSPSGGNNPGVMVAYPVTLRYDLAQPGYVVNWQAGTTPPADAGSSTEGKTAVPTTTVVLMNNNSTSTHTVITSGSKTTIVSTPHGSSTSDTMLVEKGPGNHTATNNITEEGLAKTNSVDPPRQDLTPAQKEALQKQLAARDLEKTKKEAEEEQDQAETENGCCGC